MINNSRLRSSVPEEPWESALRWRRGRTFLPFAPNKEGDARRRIRTLCGLTKYSSSISKEEDLIEQVASGGFR